MKKMMEKIAVPENFASASACNAFADDTKRTFQLENWEDLI